MDTCHYRQIVALDLGKFKSVACFYDCVSRQHVFHAFSTSPADLQQLLLTQITADPGSVIVVFETCEVSGWVHDLVTSMGFAAAVANPSHEAWRWSRIKRKTDQDDAFKMVQLTLLGSLPTVHMPSLQQRQRRRLIHYRRAVVDRRTKMRNSVRSIYLQQGLSLPRGGKAWTVAGMAQMQLDAKQLSDCDIDNLWRGRLHVELQMLQQIGVQIQQVESRLDALAESDEKIKLLRTVPGVGPRLAECVVAHLDDVTRFKSASEVASYAGLVPKQYESGTMSRKGRITRTGPGLLRSLLVEVAWMCHMHNPWAKRYIQHISRGIKGRKKIAIVALARKLLTILWAMLRDNKPWRQPEEVKCDDGLRPAVVRLSPVLTMSSLLSRGCSDSLSNTRLERWSRAAAETLQSRHRDTSPVQ